MGTEDYRARIYGRYVEAAEDELAPATLEGLRPRAAYLRRLIRRHFPPDRNAAILDLGCGHGAFLHFLREAGYRNAVGVDRSPQQVAAAARLGIPGVREGDLTATLASLPEASQDMVIAFDVIEHFTKTELIGFVDAVRRVLTPGGRWLIHVPNGESPFSGRMLFHDLTHELAFTRNSLNQLLLASGFARVECYEDIPVPHGLKSGVRWLLWQGVRLALRAWLAIETGSLGRTAIFSQNLYAIAFK